MIYTFVRKRADVLAVGALQVYKPMETLFIIAAFTTLAENFLPQLIAIPRVRPTPLCMSSEPRQLCPVCSTLLIDSRDELPAASRVLVQSFFAFTTLTGSAQLMYTLLLVRAQAVVQNVVRSTLSLTFVIAAARVVFNVKGRMLREATWEMELKGDLTKQRRVEVTDPRNQKCV